MGTTYEEKSFRVCFSVFRDSYDRMRPGERTGQQHTGSFPAGIHPSSLSGRLSAGFLLAESS
jgi:hypothetical protein